MKTDPVFVHHSRIHGKGVFAARTFKKGEVVLRWDISHPLSPHEVETLPAEDRHHVSFLSGQYTLMQAPERFVNHSCEANTRAQDFCDVAVRTIEPGEEITADYVEDFPPGSRMECHCGSQKCRKVIQT